MMTKKCITTIGLISVLFAGCSSTKPLQKPNKTAVKWMKNAVEYKANTKQTYRTAASKLPKILRDSAETASLEQQHQSYQNLPPAIILDIDETVLNNMAFEMRLNRKNETYSEKKWNKWVQSEKGKPVPGAVKFLRKAARKGVMIFYVSNREDSVKQATYNNLKKYGFPLKKGKDVVLTENKQKNWNSSKVNRRKFVGKNYRIIMLFGDDLNDFVSSAKLSHKKRKELLKKYHNWFGTRWFILPNPVYGSWQQAVKKKQKRN